MTAKDEKYVTMLSPDNGGPRVAAIASKGNVEIGVVSRKKSGVGLADGERVIAVQRTSDKGVERYRVTDEYRHEGPSRANTARYRKGWAGVFGKKRSSKEELN